MVQAGNGRFGPIGNLGRMVQLVLGRGKLPILFCDQHSIPLADICCLLRNEHFGDELHPNDRGAKIIAEAVFSVLTKASSL